VAAGEAAANDGAASDGEGESAPSDAELRRRVEEQYDFDDFGPRDMAAMSPDEWEAAFDPETWITGEALLDRVETDLERRVATRDVFAVVERRDVEGEDAVLAYSDEGYALVRGDGSVEGFGTVLRDVKPTVALSSMDAYEVEEPPAGAVLPKPDEVPEGSGELGNLMLQVIAAVLGLAGLGLLGAAVFVPDAAAGSAIGRGLMLVFGLLFLAATAVLFFTVANARLSDKFRAEEYRERLRAVGLEDGERPEFLPIEVEEPVDATLAGNDGEAADAALVDGDDAGATDTAAADADAGERDAALANDDDVETGSDEPSNPST